MISKVKSFGINGIDGYVVDVETDISKSLPSFSLVGLPDASIKESKERVQSAIKNSGMFMPVGKIVVNLAPADTRKEGVIYDLPIALGILAATGELDESILSEFAFIGELGLNGVIRRVNGVLPILITAVQKGIKKVVVPEENAHEASYIEGVEVYSARTLLDVINHLRTPQTAKKSFMGRLETRDGCGFQLRRVTLSSFQSVKVANPYVADMKYVKGQSLAKRAMEIAAAGGHNILFVGPPGSGKTMLAKCFPTILPDLTFAESIESTKIHSIAGVLDPALGVLVNRPFRTPHHTASVVALAGGGKNAKPGEISLAHNGVLFLDEMPEYSRVALEILRQPLEDNKITVARAAATVDYPASFTLIASMNPCPCGYFGSRTQKCSCGPTRISQYLARLSGPLLDRICIQVEVDSVTYDDLTSSSNEESSADIKVRVERARDMQKKRFVGLGIYCNAKMSNSQVKKVCTLDKHGERVLKDAFEKLQLSARAYSRILKVARTIADLEGCESIQADHLIEAVGYRCMDRGIGRK